MAELGANASADIAPEDIDALVALLDGYEGSRMTLQVVERQAEQTGIVERKYHHGRCDVGSPWAQGTCI